MRTGGTICVYNALRVELEPAHNEAHGETKAVASSCDHRDFESHHHHVLLHQSFSEGATLVELGFEINLAIRVERSEVGVSVKVRHTLHLRILTFLQLA